jgi:hypothetical protein
VGAAAPGGHRGGFERAAVDRRPQHDLAEPVGVGGGDPHGHGLAGRGGRGLVAEVRVCGAEVLAAGVGPSGRAPRVRAGDPGDPRQALEVQAAVQGVAAGDPARAEPDGVRGRGHRGPERGLGVVVHVLGRAGGDEPQHGVAGVVGVGHDGAVAVVPEEPPRARGVEPAVDHELDADVVAHHAHVVDQHLASVEQPEHELVPQPVGPHRRRRRDAAHHDVGPPSARGLVARRPRLGGEAVGPRIAPLERGAPAVGGVGPAPAVEVAHGVDGVAAGVPEHDAVGRVGEGPHEVPHDGHPGHLRAQRRGVASHHQEPPGGQGGALGEHVFDCVHELPAGEVHVLVAPVVELEPLVGALLDGRAVHGAGGAVVGELVEHDAALDGDRVGGAGGGLVGDPPRAGVVEAGPAADVDPDGVEQRPVAGLEDQHVAGGGRGLERDRGEAGLERGHGPRAAGGGGEGEAVGDVADEQIDHERRGAGRGDLGEREGRGARVGGGGPGGEGAAEPQVLGGVRRGLEHLDGERVEAPDARAGGHGRHERRVVGDDDGGEGVGGEGARGQVVAQHLGAVEHEPRAVVDVAVEVELGAGGVELQVEVDPEPGGPGRCGERGPGAHDGVHGAQHDPGGVEVGDRHVAEGVRPDVGGGGVERRPHGGPPRRRGRRGFGRRGAPAPGEVRGGDGGGDLGFGGRWVGAHGRRAPGRAERPLDGGGRGPDDAGGQLDLRDHHLRAAVVRRVLPRDHEQVVGGPDDGGDGLGGGPIADEVVGDELQVAAVGGAQVHGGVVVGGVPDGGGDEAGAGDHERRGAGGPAGVVVADVGPPGVAGASLVVDAPGGVGGHEVGHDGRRERVHAVGRAGGPAALGAGDPAFTEVAGAFDPPLGEGVAGAVGPDGPGLGGAVPHGLHAPPSVGEQLEPLTAVVEAPGERPERAGSGEPCGVGRDDEVAASGEAGPGGERVVDGAAEGPAGELEVDDGGVVQLDPLEGVAGPGVDHELGDGDGAGGVLDVARPRLERRRRLVGLGGAGAGVVRVGRLGRGGVGGALAAALVARGERGERSEEGGAGEVHQSSEPKIPEPPCLARISATARSARRHGPMANGAATAANRATGGAMTM